MKVCKICNVTELVLNKRLCRNCYNKSQRDKRLQNTQSKSGYFIENEIWEPCPQFESEYSISNFGRIKNAKCMRLLILQKNSWGYNIISLAKAKTKKTYILHRLIAKAFISNPKNKPQVNHINGIKTDNRVENLEWCTQSENQKHAYKTGLNKAKTGTESHFSRYSDELVQSVLACNLNDVAAAKKFGTSRSFIRDLRTGVIKRNPNPREKLVKGFRGTGYAISK